MTKAALKYKEEILIVLAALYLMSPKSLQFSLFREAPSLTTPGFTVEPPSIVSPIQAIREDPYQAGVSLPTSGMSWVEWPVEFGEKIGTRIRGYFTALK